MGVGPYAGDRPFAGDGPFAGDRPFAGEGKKNAGGLAYEVWVGVFGLRESSGSGPT